MLYALYHPDGRIHQVNKAYDPEADAARGKKSYDELLIERDQTFVKKQAPGLLQPEHWFVDVKAKEIVERPSMSIEVSKTVIKAGASDHALFTGIPKGATFAIFGPYDALLWPEPGQSNLFPATELDLSIPMPCVYRVEFELWPFRKFTVEIEAIA